MRQIREPLALRNGLQNHPVAGVAHTIQVSCHALKWRGKERRARMLCKSDSMLESSGRNAVCFEDVEAWRGAQIENAMNVELTDIDLETECDHLCYEPDTGAVVSVGAQSATGKAL